MFKQTIKFILFMLYLSNITSAIPPITSFTNSSGDLITGDNYITEAMKFIPSNTPINKLVINASHDSVSYTINDDLINNTANAQSSAGTIPEQLHRGVRWFDYRAHLVNENLIGYHGIINGDYPVNNDTNYINTFLQNNPGEFVIISLVDGDFSNEVIEKLSSILQSSNPIIIDNNNTVPLTYEQVKGRVVITSANDFSLNQCQSSGAIYDPLAPENIGHEVECIAQATAIESIPVVMHEIRAEIRIPGDASYWANYLANLLQINPLPGNASGYPALADLGIISNAGIPSALYELADDYKNDKLQLGAILHDNITYDNDLFQYEYSLMYYKFNSKVGTSTFLNVLSDQVNLPKKILFTFDSFCSPFLSGYTDTECYSARQIKWNLFNNSSTSTGVVSLNSLFQSNFAIPITSTIYNNLLNFTFFNRYNNSFVVACNKNFNTKWSSWITCVNNNLTFNNDLPQIWSHISIRAKSPIFSSDIASLNINSDAYRQYLNKNDGLNGGYVSPQNAQTVSAMYTSH